MSPSSQKYVSGRGIQQPKRPIHLERRQRVTPLEARCEHQLIHVSGRDVLLRASHAIRVSAFRQGGHRGGERAVASSVGTAPRNARMTSRLERLPLGVGPVVQQGGAARQVIEHQQRARRHVMRMRRHGRIQTASRQTLEIPHGVVGEYPTSPPDSGTPGISGLGCGEPRPGHLSGHSRSRSARSAAASGRPPTRETRCVQPHFQAVAESDERIARQPLAAFHALQQESRAKVARASSTRRPACPSRRQCRTAASFPILGDPKKKPITVKRRRWVLDIERELKLKRPAPTPSGKCATSGHCHFCLPSTSAMSIAAASRQRQEACRLFLILRVSSTKRGVRPTSSYTGSPWSSREMTVGPAS